MLDIVKIRFKIPFYSRITAKNKAQLRDCFVMHLFLKRGIFTLVKNFLGNNFGGLEIYAKDSHNP
jgi:hypothetical protein